MSDTIEYNDENLQALFAAMTPEVRLKAIRGAFRREANRVRKIAVSNLRHSGLNAPPEMEKGIRWSLLRKGAGFTVTVRPKKAGKNGRGEKGFYLSRKRRGKSNATPKPVLKWAETGTEPRRSKQRGFWIFRKGHSTGRMRSYGFMRKTLEQTVNTVTDNLHKALRETTIKEAKKYGCT